jgi:hypothetical protein
VGREEKKGSCGHGCCARCMRRQSLAWGKEAAHSIGWVMRARCACRNLYLLGYLPAHNRLYLADKVGPPVAHTHKHSHSHMHMHTYTSAPCPPSPPLYVTLHADGLAMRSCVYTTSHITMHAVLVSHTHAHTHSLSRTL